ncbi:MAG TPA: DNA gyrase subunit A [Flavobacteriales bacterium]|jgi:DNA gyrase subunit A|nr:DNA gyrase subunit A [Flavobacteriales bacterium]MBK7103201.1 DNA gyrase subunit A [Flavobacteriales bacterium]MBK7620210.1 DNA gyrase subunit A [Flavobacteriales bacterium]MBK8707227.1 DNA gyrase subunit A [Flavobacteriales bacterium]HQW05117.1 DNA gyrase subunit A [Flavobacteriales bacterium]
MAEGEKIIQINIENEMRTAYIDYSMSVIVSRALPDVRDGLKPVHRRVLYGMQDLGVLSNRAHKKSARIVGEVLGKYHPHGDSSVYDAMVRMAQDWSLRYPLVDGQGNFGSIDGDSPAAMRYTEARFKKIAEEVLADLDKETVDMRPNFDESLQEPTVMPTKVPNLLVNGASGIAVGMATNMPPHNLSEVCDGIAAYIDNKDIDVAGLMEHIKGPDFPTGGVIYGIDGIREAYETGRGKVVLRAKCHIEEDPKTSREAIVCTEIPFQTNKAVQLVKGVADLVNDKRIEGISDVNDYSDRTGIRVVYDVKREAMGSVVLNQLYKYSSLQTSFSVNSIALVGGRPMMLGLKAMIQHFVTHRLDVIVRRSKYDLRKAEERAHILEGLLIALDHLEAVIKLIRASATPDIAREGLMSEFSLSEIQARAILDMRLQRLTGLERDKIKEEYAELMTLIDRLKAILADEGVRLQIVKDETAEIKEKYGDKRRTQIIAASGDMSMEDLIADEAVVVTISHLGYIKRTALTEFRTQGRGGIGSRGSTTRDEDFLEHLFVATNHNYLLIFTQKGRVYWMRVFDIPEGTRQSKGRAIQNLVQLEGDDKVVAYLNVTDLKSEEYLNSHFVVLCTKKGVIKKTTLEAYSRPRSNGIIAVGIREGDELLEARLTNGKHHVILASKDGRAVHFEEGDVRPMGRNASGVRGMNLTGGTKENEVIGMITMDKDELNTLQVLVVSSKGYGKRTAMLDEDGDYVYRMVNRGGKGVKTMQLTDKTGELVAIKSVKDEDQLMIINRSGMTIRMDLSAMRVLGRATQGVRLIELRKNDQIAAVAKIDSELQEDEPTEGEGDADTNGEDASDDNGTVVDNE